MDTKTLIERIDALRKDERRIIEVLLDRIDQGRKVYGPWRIDDGRNYSKETFEEVIDALHYCAAALLKEKNV